MSILCVRVLLQALLDAGGPLLTHNHVRNHCGHYIKLLPV